jgi:hypothetical protein
LSRRWLIDDGSVGQRSRSRGSPVPLRQRPESISKDLKSNEIHSDNHVRRSTAVRVSVRAVLSDVPDGLTRRGVERLTPGKPPNPTKRREITFTYGSVDLACVAANPSGNGGAGSFARLPRVGDLLDDGDHSVHDAPARTSERWPRYVGARLRIMIGGGFCTNRPGSLRASVVAARRCRPDVFCQMAALRRTGDSGASARPAGSELGGALACAMSTTTVSVRICSYC